MRTMMRLPIFLGLVCISSVALAEKENPLEGQPAIRNRYQVRDNRVEAGLSLAFSLNRNLRHNILIGAKINYHINNYFSVGTDMAAGIGFNSGLHGELDDSYPTYADDDPNHTTAEKDAAYFDRLLWDRLNNRLSDVRFAGDIRFAFTPIQGRIGLFSKVFVNYDMYIFAGLGMAMTKNHGDMGDTDSDFALRKGTQVPARTGTGQATFSPTAPALQEDFVNADEANEGFRVGPAFGLGMHMMFNNFLSLGVEVKNLVFEDNETGSDFTRGQADDEIADTQAGKCKGSNAVNSVCRYVDSQDRSMVQHWYIGLNFTVFFPLDVGVTR